MTVLECGVGTTQRGHKRQLLTKRFTDCCCWWWWGSTFNALASLNYLKLAYTCIDMEMDWTYLKSLLVMMDWELSVSPEDVGLTSCQGPTQILRFRGNSVNIKSARANAVHVIPERHAFVQGSVKDFTKQYSMGSFFKSVVTLKKYEMTCKRQKKKKTIAFSKTKIDKMF